jgi:hypothetical protein
MSLANDRIVSLADKQYTLRLDISAIIELEQLTGKPFHKLSFDENTTLSDIRALLYVSLKKHHALSINDVTNIMDEAGIQNVLNALASQNEKDVTENPPTATKSRSPGTGKRSLSRGSKQA